MAFFVLFMRIAKQVFYPFLLFIFSFGAYLHNLSPSVYGVDVGDLVTASAVHGVAHPSGYPLFTLLGTLFLLLPFDATPAWKVGLISVLSASCGVVVMYALILSLLGKRVLAFLTAATMAFSYLYWLYAEVAEVFTFTSVLMLLSFFLAVQYFKTKKRNYILLLSFVFGIAIAHHEILALLIPSLAILVFSANWRIIRDWKLILVCIGLIGLGFLPYLYILIAAQGNPPINWSNVHNLSNLFHLILRLDYSWQANTAGNIIYTRFLGLQIYAYDLWIKLSPVVFLTILIGMLYMLFSKRKVIFLAFFLAFFMLGPFYLVYGFTPPITLFWRAVLERFYLLSTIPLFIFFPFGIYAVVKTFSRIIRNKHLEGILFLPFFIIPIGFFTHNVAKTDLSDVWVGDYFGIDILSPLPKNSTLYLSGDTVAFNTLYIRYARNIRSDVTIILLPPVYYDKEYLQIRERIKKERPDISDNDNTLLAMFEVAKDRPFFSYVQLTLTDKSHGEPQWMPYGLVYKLATDIESNLSEEEFLILTEHIWDTLLLPKYKGTEFSHIRNLTISEIPIAYAQSYVMVGDYLVFHYGDFEEAKRYYEKAMAFDSRTDAAYAALGFYYLHKIECQEAEKQLQQALSLEPRNETAHALLYKAYRDCFHDEAKAKEVEENYFRLFQKSIPQPQ